MPPAYLSRWLAMKSHWLRTPLCVPCCWRFRSPLEAAHRLPMRRSCCSPHRWAAWTACPLGAWGELSGAPHADSEVMTTGKGRTLAALLIVGVGTVLLMVGGAMAATGSSEFLRLYQAT